MNVLITFRRCDPAGVDLAWDLPLTLSRKSTRSHDRLDAAQRQHLVALLPGGKREVRLYFIRRVGEQCHPDADFLTARAIRPKGGVDVTEPRAADDFEAIRGQIKELQRASRNRDCDGLHMSQEELSTLIDGFDGILAKIEKRHQEELERCRSVLEQQVADRTAALSRSNQQLQRTLNVLNNSTRDPSKPVSFRIAM